MGQKQVQRWHVMKMVEVGKITPKEAGARLALNSAPLPRTLHPPKTS
jgi:hypothetical protein